MPIFLEKVSVSASITFDVKWQLNEEFNFHTCARFEHWLPKVYFWPYQYFYCLWYAYIATRWLNSYSSEDCPSTWIWPFSFSMDSGCHVHFMTPYGRGTSHPSCTRRGVHSLSWQSQQNVAVSVGFMLSLLFICELGKLIVWFLYLQCT